MTLRPALLPNAMYRTNLRPKATGYFLGAKAGYPACPLGAGERRNCDLFEISAGQALPLHGTRRQRFSPRIGGRGAQLRNAPLVRRTVVLCCRVFSTPGLLRLGAKGATQKYPRGKEQIKLYIRLHILVRSLTLADPN